MKGMVGTEGTIRRTMGTNEGTMKGMVGTKEGTMRRMVGTKEGTMRRTMGTMPTMVGTKEGTMKGTFWTMPGGPSCTRRKPYKNGHLEGHHTCCREEEGDVTSMPCEAAADTDALNTIG